MDTQPLSKREGRGTVKRDDRGLYGQRTVGESKASANLAEEARGTTERFLQSTIDAL